MASKPDDPKSTDADWAKHPMVADMLSALRPYARPGNMVDMSTALASLLASALKLVPPERRLTLGASLCTEILTTIKGSMS